MNLEFEIEIKESSGENSGIEDFNIDYCGVCGTPGTLICCETCPSSYHIECLGFERSPRGRWRCYFCKITKDGVNHATKLAPKEIDLCHILKKPVKSWAERGLQIIEILKHHPCSHHFLEPVPKSNTHYYESIQKPRDLNTIRKNVEINQYSHYSILYDDIRLVWKNCKEYNKETSSLYKQAETMSKLFEKIIQDNIFDQNLIGDFPSSEEEESNLEDDDEEIEDEEIDSEEENVISQKRIPNSNLSLNPTSPIKKTDYRILDEAQNSKIQGKRSSPEGSFKSPASNKKFKS